MDDMGDGATKEEWMARFTSSKQTAFIQLQKHKYFQDGLDRLLPFPGFWAALLMGNIQRHLALRCIEVGVKLDSTSTRTKFFLGNCYVF